MIKMKLPLGEASPQSKIPKLQSLNLGQLIKFVGASFAPGFLAAFLWAGLRFKWLLGKWGDAMQSSAILTCYLCKLGDQLNMWRALVCRGLTMALGGVWAGWPAPSWLLFSVSALVTITSSTWWVFSPWDLHLCILLHRQLSWELCLKGK